MTRRVGDDHVSPAGMYVSRIVGAFGDA